MPTNSTGTDSGGDGYCEEDCPSCREPVGDTSYICDICLSRIHKKCASLSPSEIRCMPLQNRRLALVCCFCKNNLSKSRELHELVSLLRDEVLQLKTEINSLKTITNTNYTSLCTAQTTTYADIASSRKINGTKLNQNIPSVIIKPKKQQSRDATELDVKTHIDPSELKISVKKIQTTRNGNIMIKCNDVTDTQKLKKYAQETLKDNYEIEETKLKNPQIKIVGFKQDMTMNEVEQSIKNQNSFYCNELLKITYIKENKNNTRTLYAECDAALFDKIMAQGKINIKWQRYRVYENINPPQCYNCWGFYHKNTNCVNKTICSYCGMEHTRRECQLFQTQQGKKCKNCELANLKYKTGYDLNHEASDTDCPTYKYHTQIMRSKINYGQYSQCDG